jgi:hypothetical protein
MCAKPESPPWHSVHRRIPASLCHGTCLASGTSTLALYFGNETKPFMKTNTVDFMHTYYKDMFSLQVMASAMLRY